MFSRRLGVDLVSNGKLHSTNACSCAHDIKISLKWTNYNSDAILELYEVSVVANHIFSRPSGRGSSCKSISNFQTIS